MPGSSAIFARVACQRQAQYCGIMGDLMGYLKSFIREVVPPPAIHQAKTYIQRRKIERSGAKAAFDSAEKTPVWLPQSKIAEIEARYSNPDAGDFVAEGYTESALLNRAHQRERLLRRFIGSAYKDCRRFIEVGAADSMVAWALHKGGKEVLATDIYAEGVDPRAIAANVPFEVMSATDLRVPDASYDVLYSFASLEHIDDPVAALNEAARVVRPGGYVFINFGPHYQAPEGMHLGTRLRVPFASVLFERQDIDGFMEKSGREPLNHDYCNGWVLEKYRNLFKNLSENFETELYLEHLDLSGLDLIADYPSCFRSKSDDLDSFLVSVVDVLLKRR